MTLKKFIIKTTIKVIMFVFVVVTVSSIAQSMSPLISNELALTQMQNSNEMFVLMDTYSKVRPVVNLILAGIIIWFTYTIGRDVYKFTKAINAETKKEN